MKIMSGGDFINSFRELEMPVLYQLIQLEPAEHYETQLGPLVSEAEHK